MINYKSGDILRITEHDTAVIKLRYIVFVEGTLCYNHIMSHRIYKYVYHYQLKYINQYGTSILSSFILDEGHCIAKLPGSEDYCESGKFEHDCSISHCRKLEKGTKRKS